MSLTTRDKQDIKAIVGEVFTRDLKAGIAHLPTAQTVRDIVKEETALLPTIKTVRDIVKEEIDESIMSGPLKRALTRLEKKIDFGIYRVEVLYEDTRSDIKAISELLSDNLKVKDRVAAHEIRLKDIETVQPMMIKTLKMHSKKLDTFYER